MKNAIIIMLVALLLNLFAAKVENRAPSIRVSPVSMQGNTNSSAFIDMIFTMVTWNKFLDSVEASHKTIIIWSGYGGYLLVESLIVKRLAELQETNKIEILVTGFTASAHALALCELKNVYHTPMAMLLFHAPISTDGQEVFRSKKTYDACLKTGFLTQKDVDALTSLTPMEVWVTFTTDNKRQVTYRPDRRLLINGGTAI